MTVDEIAKMMDVSAVQAQSTREDIDACCELVAEYGCAAVFCLPAHVPYLRARLDARGLKVPMASVSGFPGGAETPRTKARTARELVGFGCDEVDMVNNIAWLKAGEKAAYVDDVAGVVEAAGGIRSLATLQALYDAGARRFGVGVNSARAILAEIT